MITEEAKKLINRIESGIDVEAETELLARYGPRIERKVYYYLGQNNPDSLDIINESKLAVLLAVREGRFDISKEMPLGSYIYGVTKNKISDYFSDRRKDQTTILEFVKDSSQRIDANIELERKELRNAMRNFLSSLDIKYQEVLYLKFYDGLTIPEISEEIDLPLKKVSERIHYALTILKIKFKNRKYFQYFNHF